VTMLGAWVILVVVVIVVVIGGVGVLVSACLVGLLSMDIGPPLYLLDPSTLNPSHTTLPHSLRSPSCADAFAVTEPLHTEVPNPT